MRAGITVSRNDTGHSAQHPHGVGDGRTVAGYPHSTGAGFPGGVRAFNAPVGGSS
jgi:hypothetical protein